MNRKKCQLVMQMVCSSSSIWINCHCNINRILENLLTCKRKRFNQVFKDLSAFYCIRSHIHKNIWHEICTANIYNNGLTRQGNHQAHVIFISLIIIAHDLIKPIRKKSTWFEAANFIRFAHVQRGMCVTVVHCAGCTAHAKLLLSFGCLWWLSNTMR